MTFCINCGRKTKIFKNGLCYECAKYLFEGENDDFVNVCPVWWPIMEKVEKYKKLSGKLSGKNL